MISQIEQVFVFRNLIEVVYITFGSQEIFVDIFYQDVF